MSTSFHATIAGSHLISAPTPARAPVVWITGLSGVGKSTLAAGLAERLRSEGRTPLVLDGDQVRSAVGRELGHDPADRLENARRLVRLAALSSQQGVPTIVATMSLFAEIHRSVRAELAPVLVVYMHAPMELLEARDPKGVYARVRRGESRHVVGVDLPFDVPESPDLVINAGEPSRGERVPGERWIDAIRSSLERWMPITKA